MGRGSFGGVEREGVPPITCGIPSASIDARVFFALILVSPPAPQRPFDRLPGHGESYSVVVQDSRSRWRIKCPINPRSKSHDDAIISR